MLLVEHDQPQAGQGQKDRRAGPHRQQGLAPQASPPAGHPGGVGHAAVELHHARTEALLAAVEQLGDQADLRCQQQGAAAGGQAAGGGLQVHLGLARAGHTPEQKCAARRRRLDGGQGLPLGGGEGARRRGGPARGILRQGRPPGGRALFTHQQLPALQAGHGGTAEAAWATQLAQGHRCRCRLQVQEQGPLARAEPGGQVSTGGPHQPLGTLPGWRGLAPLSQPAGRQSTLEGAEHAGVTLSGHGGDQRLPLGGHGGRLQPQLHGLQGPQPQVDGRCVQQLHHETTVAPALEPHLHQITYGQGEAAGVGVGEDLPFPAGLQPDLNPAGSTHTCKGHPSFIGCDCWAAIVQPSEPDRVPSSGKT